MALIPLFEAKTYLRVDSGDEDALIGILLSSAEQMCKDVGRLTTTSGRQSMPLTGMPRMGSHQRGNWKPSAALAVWQFYMRWAICTNTGTKRTISS